MVGVTHLLGQGQARLGSNPLHLGFVSSGGWVSAWWGGASVKLAWGLAQYTSSSCWPNLTVCPDGLSTPYIISHNLITRKGLLEELENYTALFEHGPEHEYWLG